MGIESLKDNVFDIVILAGQSNAQGNGKGGTLIKVDDSAYELIDKNPIKVYDSPVYKGETVMELVIPVEMTFRKLQEQFDGQEYVADLSISFANDYIKDGNLINGRKLLVVKASVGGTGFSKKQWGVGNKLSDRFIQMVDVALKANEGNRIVGLLWHQGEHDAFENARFTAQERYDFYCSEFTKQMILFREKYGKNLPIITGGIVDEWANKNKVACDAIEKALMDSCKKLTKATFVSSDGLLSNNQVINNGDDIHFCRESIYELGRRYYSQWKILQNK